MSDIGTHIEEGRRCAGVIDSLAEKVDELVTGEDCELRMKEAAKEARMIERSLND